MKTVSAALVLLFVALIAGCGGNPKEDSRNIDAILSPDGSRIAFARSFRYYFNKASVFNPGGWEETVYEEMSIYVMDRTTDELTKMAKFDEAPYHCSRYDCPVRISWEGDLIAYSVRYAIYVMDLSGDKRGFVDLAREKYGPPIPFTLSGDARRLFYLGRHPWEYDREGLYSVELDGTGKSFITELKGMGYHDIYDMMWDSSQNCILIVERAYSIAESTVWQIAPDGSGLKESERGLMEYRRRRLGGWDSKPPFSELEKLTRGISYAEWDVPPPDEFD